MSTFIIILHIFVCIVIIMMVLLQSGKGTDMGAAFGGGSSQTLFGSTGASTFLSKATTVVAIVFMLTSLYLAYVSGHPKTSSLLNNSIENTAPAVPEANPVPKAESKKTDTDK